MPKVVCCSMLPCSSLLRSQLQCTNRCTCMHASVCTSCDPWVCACCTTAITCTEPLICVDAERLGAHSPMNLPATACMRASVCLSKSWMLALPGDRVVRQATVRAQRSCKCTNPLVSTLAPQMLLSGPAGCCGRTATRMSRRMTTWTATVRAHRVPARNTWHWARTLQCVTAASRHSEAHRISRTLQCIGSISHTCLRYCAGLSTQLRWWPDAPPAGSW
jgi:hypothetical protein